MKIAPLVVSLSALAGSAFAQATIKDALVKHWKSSADFTLAVADAMPADGYTFKPVPEEMSFGQVMIHIGTANLGACANAGGMDRPAVPARLQDASKDEKVAPAKGEVMQFLRDSFDFCNKSVAAITPEKLDAMVGPQNRKMTGYEWLWSYFTHTAHHRGQAEVYLRVKGIKPPTYVF